MADTQNTGSDKVLEVLDKVVKYATTGNYTIAVAAGMILSAVNTIADLIGSRRVTLTEVIDAMEGTFNEDDATIRDNVNRLRAELGLPPRVKQ